MSTEIDVHSVGLELIGLDSYITGFQTAVPEPSTCLLGLLGLIGAMALRRGIKT